MREQITMWKLITILSMMCLVGGASSCGSTQRKLVCAQLRSAEIKPLPLCDISFQFNRCRCRCFDFNQWATRPLTDCRELSTPDLEAQKIFVVEQLLEGKAVVLDTVEAIDFPLEKCEGIAGFYLQDMANEVAPKIKKLDNIKETYCD